MPLSHSQVRRILATGARIGSVEELVGLNKADMEWIRLREALSDLLLETRRSRGLSQIEFARIVDTTQAAVSRAESADPTVSTDWILRCLIAAGRTCEDISRALHPG